MKFDKSNPRHWLLLAATIVTIVAIWIQRPFLFRRNRRPAVVIFYGHTLNGNLKSLFEYMCEHDDYEPYFLCLGKEYYDRLAAQPKYRGRLLHAASLGSTPTIARSHLWVTSHGAHLFAVLRRTTSIKFVDLWHGIPYKGFDADDLGFLHDYDGVFVSSPFLKRMYQQKFGFQQDNVQPTGYGRVDYLVNQPESKNNVLKRYDVPKAKKYVLIAPTWQQDDKGRSELPFGTDAREFFGQLDAVAQKNNALIIYRTHLNSKNDFVPKGLKHTVFMPYAQYEIAEDFLYFSDVLVTDWSSIAFDYLPLDRPTIFLDVPAPFKKGFSLGPEYRFGDVVSTLDELCSSIDTSLKKPEAYLARHQTSIKKAKRDAYGDTLDGKSTERYEAEIRKILGR